MYLTLPQKLRWCSDIRRSLGQRRTRHCKRGVWGLCLDGIGWVLLLRRAVLLWCLQWMCRGGTRGSEGWSGRVASVGWHLAHEVKPKHGSQREEDKPTGPKTAANSCRLHWGINPVMIPTPAHTHTPSPTPIQSNHLALFSPSRILGSHRLTTCAIWAPNRNAAIDRLKVTITWLANARTSFPGPLS